MMNNNDDNNDDNNKKVKNGSIMKRSPPNGKITLVGPRVGPATISSIRHFVVISI